MKHWGMRVLAVGLYVSVLAGFMKWNPLIFFDIRILLLFVAGDAIFAFLIYRKKNTTRDIRISLRNASYPAGILYFLLLVFYQCLETGETRISLPIQHLLNNTVYFRLKENGLTEREIEVTNFIIKGFSNYEIAEELYITEATVKKHVTHIFEKLNVSGRKQLAEAVSALEVERK